MDGLEIRVKLKPPALSSKIVGLFCYRVFFINFCNICYLANHKLLFISLLKFRYLELLMIIRILIHFTASIFYFQKKIIILRICAQRACVVYSCIFNVKSSEFFISWRRLSKFKFYVYLSSNSADYSKFFDYLD